MNTKSQLSPAPLSFISTDPLFRSLTAAEVEEFRCSAREKAIMAVAGLSKPIYHPVYRDEIRLCIERLARIQPPAPVIAPPVWSLEDTYAAYRDGWGLFQNDDGSFVIQRLDDPQSCPDEANVTDTEPAFDSDESALGHVEADARAGNPLAIKAMQLTRGIAWVKENVGR